MVVVVFCTCNSNTQNICLFNYFLVIFFVFLVLQNNISFLCVFYVLYYTNPAFKCTLQLNAAYYLNNITEN